MSNAFIISSIALILMLLAITLIAFYWKKRKYNFIKRESRAVKAFQEANYEKAKKLYNNLISELESSTEKNWKAEIIEKKVELLGKVYFGIGSTYQKLGNETVAFENYIKAEDLNFPIDSDAIILICQKYVEIENIDSRAVSSYLDYLEIKNETDLSEKIYNLLEKACYIDERTSEIDKITRMDYLKHLSKNNHEIEWIQFYFGVGHFIDGNFSDGVMRLIKAQSLDSTRPMLFYWLGLGYLHQFDFNEEEVFENFKKFLEFTFDDDYLNQKQAEAAYELGKIIKAKVTRGSDGIDLSEYEVLVEAIYYFQIAQTKDPGNSTYLFNIGEIYSLQADSGRAIQYFEKAIAIDANNKLYFLTIAIELKKTNSFDKALKNLNKALSIDLKYGKAHRLVAEIYIILEDYEKAEGHCRVAANCGLTNTKFTLILIHALYYQHKFDEIEEEIGGSDFLLDSSYENEIGFYIARAFAKCGNFEIAINWYKKLPLTTRNLYYLGCTLAHIGKYEEALSSFRNVDKDDNDFSYRFLLEQAKVFMMMGSSEESKQKLIEAISIDENDYESFMLLGQLYFNVGDYENGEKYFKKALQLNPNIFSALFGLGIIEEMKKNYSEALCQYEKALNLLNSDLLKLRLGILKVKIGKYDEAFKDFQELISTEFSPDSLLYYYGLAAFFTGKEEKSLQSWQKLAPKDSNHEYLNEIIKTSHYFFGVSLIEQNVINEAIAQWEICLNFNKEDKKLEKDLAEIYFRAALTETTRESPNYHDSIELNKMAIKFNPISTQYKFFNALFHFGLEQYEESERYLTEILDSEPDNTKAIYHMGLVKLNKDETNKALEIFRNIIEGKNANEYKKYSRWILANEEIVNCNHLNAVKLLESS